MKKLIFALFVSALIVLTIVPLYAQVEMLSNGDFESWTVNGTAGPPDNWSLSSSSFFSASQEATTVHAGTYSVNLTWSTTSTRNLEQMDIPVMADSAYILSAWVYDNDPDGRVRVNIRWEYSGGGYISNSYSDYSSDNSNWLLLSTDSVTAPSNAAQCKVRIACYDISGWDGDATVYVDDASLSKVIPVGPTTIYDVQFNNTTQGSDSSCYPSPEDGNTVTITGVVTGITENTSYDNFWIQDSSGLWHGIYAFDNSIHPSRGDSITLTGSISEYWGLTEIDPSSHQVHATGRPEPSPIKVTSADLAGGCSAIGESYEGVLVRIDSVVVTQDLNEHSEWYVSDDGGATECQIDDKCFHYNPTVGESLTYIIGVVHYSYSEYEINPRSIDDIGRLGGPPPFLSIYDVQFNNTNQGSGDDCYPSPYEDSLLTITGVVTGITRNIGYDNFWLQDSAGCWSGVYIFDNTISPSVGDSMTITGSISEYYGLTEVSVSEYETHTHGVSGFTPIALTADDLDDGCSTTGESYEGVLVRIENVVVTDTSGFTVHGEWYISDDGGAHQCQIDDMCFPYEPEIGDTLTSIIGVVHYSGGEYEINPRSASDIVPLHPDSTLKIYLIDVGQGDATLMVSPAGKTLLMDGGQYGMGYDRIVPLMDNLGVGHLDFMVASHYDGDHIGGLDEVVNGGYPPGIAYDRGDSVGGNQFNQYLDAIRDVRQTIDTCQVIDLGGGVTITCLTVDACICQDGCVDTTGTSETENSLSVGLLVEYGDFDYWVSGDLTGGGFGTANVESVAAEVIGDVDVLRVNHHGSGTSTHWHFTNTLLPDVSVISVGDNDFGHPHQWILNRLNDLITMQAIYQTETGSGGTADKVQVANGTVLIETDGSTYTVSGGDLIPTTYDVDEVRFSPTVVINEVMKNPAYPPADEDGEWFELYNATDEVIDLQNWTIKDDYLDNFVITSSLEILPHGYVVFGTNGNPEQNGGYTPDYVYNWFNDFRLSNADDEIILMNGDQVVDFVYYDDGLNWPDDEDKSMQLSNPYLNNNVGANWASTTDSTYGTGHYGTPGYQNSNYIVAVGNRSETQLPITFHLSQNYPNPFNSNTVISYQLSAVGNRRSAVSLKIYNIAGQLVRTLVDGAKQPGRHSVVWNGMDKEGHSVASGIYLCRLRVGNLSQTMKMVLLR